jgi:trk system potassium uptake protein TrkH
MASARSAMKNIHFRHIHPSVLLATSFAAAILIGGVVLSLPVSGGQGRVGFLDALFTSTSATCVTGLVVVDTGTAYSRVGQLVILGLIQAGGLGIMTFAIFFTLLLGRSISFQDRMVIQDSLHHSPTSELRSLVRYILGFTLAVETAGALLLFLRWRSDFSDGRALYLGFFHAISAFCNAGFSPLRDNLMGYRGDTLVNLVITGLIVVGGLGFLVNMELRDNVIAFWRRRRRESLSLHSKLALTVTAWLLLAGTVAFLAIEWDNLLRDLPSGQKLLASWFQAVTPRTAGFNTLDYGRATTATLFVTVLLMFVGASPGSTGGGIKTTSLGLLVGLMRARWAGRGRAMLFRRTVPHAVMDRALTLSLLSGALIVAAVLALLLTEQGSNPHATAEPRFIQLLFESVSAFGTVGLSTGITHTLTPLGKIIIILLMYVGRVGPLTIALAAGRRREKGRFRYAEENVMVG